MPRARKKGRKPRSSNSDLLIEYDQPMSIYDEEYFSEIGTSSGKKRGRKKRSR